MLCCDAGSPFTPAVVDYRPVVETGVVQLSHETDHSDAEGHLSNGPTKYPPFHARKDHPYWSSFNFATLARSNTIATSTFLDGSRMIVNPENTGVPSSTGLLRGDLM